MTGETHSSAGGDVAGGWAVVATVREPPALTLAFAAHHLVLGAAELWLFFDDAADPSADLADRLPRTRVIRCDAEYWAMRRLARPALQSDRQLANATYAYNRSDAAWMLHVDADEFLWCRRPLAEELARLAPDDGWLKLNNLERVWLTPPDRAATIFEGAFRRRIERGWVNRAIYGRRRQFLRYGFAGHTAGKALSRTGRQYQLYVHTPWAGRGEGKYVPPHVAAEGVFLLHFDGLTPWHWAAKTLRYAAHDEGALDALLHPKRQRQVRHVRDACPRIADVLAFNAQLKELGPLRALAVRVAGGLAEARIDPGRALDTLLPGHGLDLSPAGFDAALAPHYATHLAQVSR
ncbi:MAG: glycosyltransferase family 2 protein [Pseudomonadota bacterium]